MKVLMINGSPRKEGNCYSALSEMKEIFDKEGIDSEIVNIGAEDIRGCKACFACGKLGRCVIDDAVNAIAPKFQEADGFVVASPVYYASPNGNVISFLDRLFCSTPFDKTMKVGASIAVARRGGCTATYDVLNKYFSISGMPIAPSQYWNIAHGSAQGEAKEDLEGMQTMRTLARNMAFLMKSIALGKESMGLPEKEEGVRTSFIR